MKKKTKKVQTFCFKIKFILKWHFKKNIYWEVWISEELGSDKEEGSIPQMTYSKLIFNFKCNHK